MKKLFAIVTMALLVCLLCTAVTGCKKQTDDTTNNGGSTTPEIKIESVTATKTSETLKVGESLLITNFYEIKGNATLSSAQRACTYTSSDSAVVKIDGKRAVAVSSGTATVTVTSDLDNTKSCTFTVVVEKVFFDRELGFNLDDDFTNEWDSANDKPGYIKTTSEATNYYYAAGVNSTKWYFEADFVLNSVGDDPLTEEVEDDRWPKLGIVTMTKDSSGKESMVVFYLNATIGANDTYDENGALVKGDDNLNWNEFGVCEVNNKNWAWDEGITDSMARHHDFAWNTGDAKITFGTKFTLGVARDGSNFHVYVNGNYMGSYQLDTSMGILAENGQALSSYVGVFEFNSDVTFSNYSVTTDIPANRTPATPNYITEFVGNGNTEQ